ncbi:hypothetical protein P175DRAFT_0527168 [Aspergillus ochraceoroseus IBT 24754]|uniref:BZIP domain-containing protein n=2 Tax=Aspergillus ochraceoroseus TaxID=138278 RepID=A0A2T5M593_9EURO|nr:uncharacterized protein P175DRAFT_0527168 [Aspergillus ochraceoroseus IBT 24754]KKK23146.1 hypothetical protein AOCH_002293 [Aspergillus ochraceoroseus]PTU23718.1 hypothetical protein P175DRAFT_0527168 [Aspergillus ochraceoroseus IBT 24754]
MLNSDSAVLSSPAHQRPKRVVTEARKLQNREAQRAYRQRQKERLKNDEKLSKMKRAPGQYQPLRPYPAAGKCSSPSQERVVDRARPAPVTGSQEPQNRLNGPQVYGSSPQSQFRFEETPLPDASLALRQLPTGQESVASASHSFSSHLEAAASDQPYVETWSSGIPNLDRIGNRDTGTALFSYSPPDFSGIDDLLLGEPPHTESLSLGDLEKQAESNSGGGREASPSEDPVDQVSRRTPDSVRNTTTNTLQTNMASPWDPLNLVPKDSPLLVPQLPNPYTNRLHTTRTSLLTACMYNALSIGIRMQEFLNYNSMTVCSPFYRPATAGDDPKALLAAVSNPSIPIHLRPTLPQVLFPHHPFFDLIPIPVLRARAITLAATSPNLVNTFDLKKDIVEGGLVCWGAVDTANLASGQPWDLRSWEAAPWFLQKWKLLLNGNDGDLWQQSIWFQAMRGGDISAF